MMGIKRYELSEAHWLLMAPLLPGKTSDPGRTGSDNRLFVNGCLWVLRSGAHWRDLPERYGKWKSVRRRFSRWCHAGVWEVVFNSLTADHDNQYLMFDSTIVRAHQQAATGKGGPRTRRWGVPEVDLTTKIHMLADTHHAWPGQRHHSRPDLLESQEAEAVLADKAYGSNDLRDRIAAMKARAGSPSKRNRKALIPHDVEIYRHRNRIERCFNRLKHFRRFTAMMWLA